MTKPSGTLEENIEELLYSYKETEIGGDPTEDRSGLWIPMAEVEKLFPALLSLYQKELVTELLWVKDLVTSRNAEDYYMSPAAEVELDERIHKLTGEQP